MFRSLTQGVGKFANSRINSIWQEMVQLHPSVILFILIVQLSNYYSYNKLLATVVDNSKQQQNIRSDSITEKGRVIIA